MPTLLSQIAANGASINAVTTGAIDTTGAALLVAVSATVESVADPTIVDSASNTWTSLTAVAVSGQSQAQIHYVVNPTTSATHTFSISLTGSAPSLSIMAFAGVSLSSPFDQQNGASTSGNATSQSTGSITPTENGELLVYGLSGNMGLGDYTGITGAPAGMTGMRPLVPGTAFAVAGGYGVQGTAAAVTATFNWITTTGANPAAVIASFKAAAVAGGGGGSYAFA